MKVGILTFHRAHNYGALLQCYALKKYIESMGHTVSFVDYWPDYHANTYNLLPDFTSISLKGKIKALLLFLIGIDRIFRRRRVYLKFMQSNLGLEREVQYKTDDSMKNDKYDVVVYGSDQIWWSSTLPSFKGYDSVYWGKQSINAKKKITYAPSMGVVNYNDEELKLLKNMLDNFDALSVRENAVKELLEKNFGLKSKVVLDPVFLLDKIQWEGFCESTSPPAITNQKYIFFYQLMRDDDACRLVEKAAQYFGCRVIEIRGRVDSLSFGSRFKQTVCPIGFVQLIRNAHFVVTTSFHGTAFSLIFEKQFFAIGMGKNSERAKSLLANIGVESRYIDNASNPDFSEVIDYEQVNLRINILKTESIQFLSCIN